MAKYIIWDKLSDIYTSLPHHISGKTHWTAAEYIAEVAPWAGLPEAKVIVSGGVINGSIFEDFYGRVEFYKNQGVEIADGMSDNDILALMEDYDNNPPLPPEEIQYRELVNEVASTVDIILNAPTEADAPPSELLAREHISFLQCLAKKITLENWDAIQFADIYPEWHPGFTCGNGTLVKYGVGPRGISNLYNAKAVTNAQIPPDLAPSVYEKIWIDSKSGLQYWVQPYAAEFGYSKGERVKHGPTGFNYESLVNENIYDVSIATAWKKV